MRDPSTTHGLAITHFCVARRQCVKRGEKLKATESWRMNWQKSEEVDNFNCLGVTMESAGW